MKSLASQLGFALFLLFIGAARTQATEAWQEDSPYVSAMPSHEIVEAADKEFDAVRFCPGRKTESVEGRVWSKLYQLKPGAKQPSELQIMRNYANAVKELGGTVLFEGAPDAACKKEVCGKVLTGKVIKANKEIWIEAAPCNDGLDYWLTVVEKEVMRQEVTVEGGKPVKARAPVMHARDNPPRNSTGLPTWPREFSMGLGEHVSYGIPVTQAGAVSLRANWKGVPLSLVLRDQQGKELARIDAAPGPTAALNYQATVADIRRGPIWTATLDTPQGTSKPGAMKQAAGPLPPLLPVAAGSFTASYPLVDEATVEASLPQLKRQHADHFATLVDTRKIGQPPTAIGPEADRQKKVEALDQALRTKWSAASGNGIAKPGVGYAKVDTTPTILSISPANGSPSDLVSIESLFVPPSYAGVEAEFRFGNQMVRANQDGNPVANPANNVTTFKFRVPKAPLALSDTMQVNVNLITLNVAPQIRTQSVPFQFDPYPAPAITSVIPDKPTSRSLIYINGARFQPDDKVILMRPGQAEAPFTDIAVPHAAQIRARIPDYAASEAIGAHVVVVNRTGKRSAYPITLQANQSFAAGLDRAQGEPGEPLLITGKLLKNAKVTLAARPRDQQTAGATYIAESPYYGDRRNIGLAVEQTGDEALLVRLPPTLDGFSGPMLVDITISGSGKPVTLPFTLKPLYGRIYFRVGSIDDQFDRQEADDVWVNITRDPNYKNSNAWLSAKHSAGFFIGHRGDDTFTSNDMQVTTEYNWSFDRAEVTSFAQDASSHMTHAGLTADNRPTVSVHWYADASWNFVMYFPAIILRGPKGVPYAKQIGTSQRYIAGPLQYLESK